MFALILGGLIIVAALVTYFVTKHVAALAGVLLGIGVAALSMFYSVGQGEAAAVRDTLDGDIRAEAEQGIRTKAPWERVYIFDVRDNVIEFAGQAESTLSGADIRNAQITIQDSEGVSSNMDVTINYSILPDSVGDILDQYGSQDAFVQRIALVRTRSAVRDVPGDFTTLELLTDRERLAFEIEEGMRRRLDGTGIVVEAVNLQEIRVPDAVRQRFENAQEARIEVETAQAEQETALVNANTRLMEAEIEAETQRVAAQGEADANSILAESLSPEVLQQRYIEALKEAGTVYVVPEGSSPLVQVAP